VKGPAFQQPLKSIWCQKIHGLYHYIGGQGLAMATDSDSPHPRSAGSLNAGGRILDDNASGGWCADARGCG